MNVIISITGLLYLFTFNVLQKIFFRNFTFVFEEGI